MSMPSSRCCSPLGIRSEPAQARSSSATVDSMNVAKPLKLGVVRVEIHRDERERLACSKVRVPVLSGIDIVRQLAQQTARRTDFSEQ